MKRTEIFQEIQRMRFEVTLGIYSVHVLWLKIGIGSGIIITLSATLISLLLSVSLILAFQQFKIMEYIFLGGAQKLTLDFFFMQKLKES